MDSARINQRLHGHGRIIATGLAAGFAGGVAEIAWIMLYASFAGGDSAAVANEVTASISPALAASGMAVPLGVAIHMGLAVLLGAAIAIMLRRALPRLAGTVTEFAIVIGLLVTVWAVNFLLVLPAINPAFIELVPLAVGLTSKVLFGAAAALVFYRRGRRSAT